MKYEAKTTVTSNVEATVTVVSGAVRGDASSVLVPVGRAFVPISASPTPWLQYHSGDQFAFAESLRTELVRLGIVKSASADPNVRNNLRIQINFVQTYHNADLQEYVLDVAVEITGGKEPRMLHYRIVSSEKDSVWEKWNTNAYEGKAKATRILLEKIIPDIERYVSSI